MNAVIAPRRPQAVRTFTDYLAGVSLGAGRPVSNEGGTVWAALDGEVYNHSALHEALRRRGHRFASGVDTELLVHLYEEHGAGMVDQLEGMYAFALWDARREELLVGRDRFGEKPLFYAERHGELHFASELDALLAGIGGVPDLDPASVDAFFVLGYVPGPASIVRGVSQLPPGHLLHWRRSSRRAQVDRYWRPATAAVRSRNEAFDELVAETGRMLERAVSSRLIGDVPFGVLLNSGLDSTLVATLAASASGEPIKTFTAGFDTWPAGETANARLTAQELGTEHHEVVLTQDELLGRVPALLSGMDQPLADPGLVVLHAIAEHASRDVTVAIGDAGANELFGGYSRYRWLWRSERLGRALPPPARPPSVGMQASLEVRTPYLNRELAEFAATVPEHIHVQDGGKALLRGLLARVAPRAAARCSKTTSGVPAADWLRGPLAPLVDHQLAHGSAGAEGWFDRGEAAALVADHRNGVRDASAAIWALLAFGLWLDRLRDRT